MKTDDYLLNLKIVGLNNDSHDSTKTNHGGLKVKHQRKHEFITTFRFFRLTKLKRPASVCLAFLTHSQHTIIL